MLALARLARVWACNRSSGCALISGGRPVWGQKLRRATTWAKKAKRIAVYTCSEGIAAPADATPLTSRLVTHTHTLGGRVESGCSMSCRKALCDSTPEATDADAVASAQVGLKEAPMTADFHGHISRTGPCMEALQAATPPVPQSQDVDGCLITRAPTDFQAYPTAWRMHTHEPQL